ncbi:hypothetical protein HKI87_12g70340 [Chloropicon roscoffensis]|uniref:Uncharacterized protein n=2 Tax=Chloropicon roscoffensis TaxID=1461544 RepID=A0AAX4PHJ4_9CHLO
MVPDRPEREGRLHDQLLELESIRSAGLLTAAEHKSKREAVISRWEESQARILRQREVIETTLAEKKAKTQQLLHALRATVKHGSDLLSKKQMAGVRQAYLELTGLSSLPSAVPKLRDLCARCVAENFVPRRGRAGPSGAKRRAEDALDIDRETWGSFSLPDQPLDDLLVQEDRHPDHLEDRGAPAPATPGEVSPAPADDEEPQEPEEPEEEGEVVATVMASILDQVAGRNLEEYVRQEMIRVGATRIPSTGQIPKFQSQEGNGSLVREVLDRTYNAQLRQGYTLGQVRLLARLCGPNEGAVKNFLLFRFRRDNRREPPAMPHGRGQLRIPTRLPFDPAQGLGCSKCRFARGGCNQCGWEEDLLFQRLLSQGWGSVRKRTGERQQRKRRRIEVTLSPSTSRHSPAFFVPRHLREALTNQVLEPAVAVSVADRVSPWEYNRSKQIVEAIGKVEEDKTSTGRKVVRKIVL